MDKGDTVIQDTSFELIEKIGNEIIAMVETHGIDYIDACIEIANIYDVDYDDVGDMISKHQRLKELVRKDAKKLNYLKADNKTEFEYE